MIAPDVAQAADALHAYWRARVLCRTAEPHSVVRPPCQKHEQEAVRQLRPAVASSSVTEGSPAFLGADDDGAAGRVKQPVRPSIPDLMERLKASLAEAERDRLARQAARTSNENRPGTVNPEPAVRADATAQNGR